MKTKSSGVRIPLKLFELVRSAEPDKTFSDIVCCALKEKYGFSGPINLSKTNIDKVVHKTKDSVENELDKLFGCAQSGS